MPKYLTYAKNGRQEVLSIGESAEVAEAIARRTTKKQFHTVACTEELYEELVATNGACHWKLYDQTAGVAS